MRHGLQLGDDVDHLREIKDEPQDDWTVDHHDQGDEERRVPSADNEQGAAEDSTGM